MTLITAISRSHAYVIACGDMGSFHGFDDNAPFLGNTAGGDSKSVALTEYVLVLHGGCRAIGVDFLDHMTRDARPADDIDDCREYARDFVAWAEEHDRPGEPYPNPNVPGGWAARGALKPMGFNFVMVGFRRDGRTRLVQYQADLGFEDFDDADVGEFACGTPYGVPDADVQPFFQLLEAPLPLYDAFSHVYGLHRTLLRRHPDKVTREMRGDMLRWRDGEPPERITLSCDVSDFDAFAVTYAQLARVPAHETL